jgi:hypothetical protein
MITIPGGSANEFSTFSERLLRLGETRTNSIELRTSLSGGRTSLGGLRRSLSGGRTSLVKLRTNLGE